MFFMVSCHQKADIGHARLLTIDFTTTLFNEGRIRMPSEIFETVDTVNAEIENMYLNFRVDNKIYGIKVKCILRIVRIQKIIEIPEMPSYMKGIMNWDDHLIPVMNMQLLFGKNEEVYTDHTCIIIAQISQKKTGLIVDEIQDIVFVEPKNISLLSDIDKDAENCIMGVARLDNGDISMLINAEKLIIG